MANPGLACRLHQKDKVGKKTEWITQCDTCFE